MAGAGIKKSSEDLAQKCLLVCPPKFDGLVTALNTQVRPSPLTFEDFCALLQEEELRLKAREGGGRADAAFSATTAKGPKGNSSKNGDNKKKGGKAKFKGECFYCKKKGHTIAECRTKKEDEKNGNLKPYNKGKQIANTAEAELDLFVVIEEVCSSMEEVSHNSSWVLDSGASCHMTGEKSLYSSMQPLEEPVTVTVGNNLLRNSLQ